MKEAAMNRTVLTALATLDPVRVENRACPGTPDINYVEGWLEDKYLERWPRNCDREPVKIPHFTPQQRVWLGQRWRVGGNAHMLLLIEDDWMLFTGEAAREFVGRATRPVLFERALARWKHKLNKQELLQLLSRSLRQSGSSLPDEEPDSHSTVSHTSSS